MITLFFWWIQDFWVTEKLHHVQSQEFRNQKGARSFGRRGRQLKDYRAAVKFCRKKTRRYKAQVEHNLASVAKDALINTSVTKGEIRRLHLLLDVRGNTVWTMRKTKSFPRKNFPQSFLERTIVHRIPRPLICKMVRGRNMKKNEVLKIQRESVS